MFKNFFGKHAKLNRFVRVTLHILLPLFIDRVSWTGNRTAISGDRAPAVSY